MISEIIKEKKFQSRAFMILPMTFNIGVIIGPILGGILSDPVNSYPGLFGSGSYFGGADGVWWMRNWPYALPNLVSAMFLTISSTAVFLGLDEVCRKPTLWFSSLTIHRRTSSCEENPMLGADYSNSLWRGCSDGSKRLPTPPCRQLSTKLSKRWSCKNPNGRSPSHESLDPSSHSVESGRETSLPL